MQGTTIFCSQPKQAANLDTSLKATHSDTDLLCPSLAFTTILTHPSQSLLASCADASRSFAYICFPQQRYPTAIYTHDNFPSTPCTDDGGNWYCDLVNAITYTGVGGEGSYNKITNMDSTSGTCSSSPFGYSGSLSPLNEPVRNNQ